MSAMDTVARYWYCKYQSELMPICHDPEPYRAEAEKLEQKLRQMGVDPKAKMPDFEPKKTRRR